MCLNSHSRENAGYCQVVFKLAKCRPKPAALHLRGGLTGPYLKGAFTLIERFHQADPLASQAITHPELLGGCLHLG